MAKIVRTNRIEESLIDELSKIAELEFDGNSTAALEACLEQAIAMRKISEQERWRIYSGLKQRFIDDLGIKLGSKEEIVAIKTLCAALLV